MILRQQVIVRDKKGPIHQEIITILNEHDIIIATQFIKHNLVELKGEIEKSTMTVENFNISPTVTY